MDWYTNEIIDGLTKLLSLSLDRTPAADSVQITAATWIEFTTTGRVWDQHRDTPRIRAAFATLGVNSTHWPSPRLFLDSLPRVEMAALTYEVKPASREEAAAAMARIRAMLDEPMPTFQPEPKPVHVADDGRTLAEHEADLHRHYSDRKIQSAGDAP